MKKRIDWALVALAGALLIGGYFRLWDLTAQSLFLDEGYTFMVAGKAWPQFMYELVYHDFHPPLFYALTHYAIAWLHWQFWDYRYLTAPFGLITVIATFAIARRLFGDVAAGIAALLVAVEPTLIQWDRLYRMYSVMTALAAVSWWVLLIAQEKTGRKRVLFWILYALLAIVQPYIHYLGALTVMCQSLYALTNVRKLWPAIASGVAAAVALLPWAWAIRIQYPNGAHVAGTPNLPISWSPLMRDVLLAGVPLDWVRPLAFDWTVLVVGLATIAIGIWLKPRSILPFWLGVAALQIVGTIVTGKGLVIPRYLLPVVPAIAIAMGATFAWLLASRARVIGAVGAVAVPALFIVCCANVVYDPYYQFPDWYLVNLVVLQNEHRDDAMLFVQGFPYVVVGDFTAFRNHPADGPAMPEDLPYAFKWLKRHAGQRVWYIENQYFYPDPDKKLKAYLDRTRKIVKLSSGRPAIWSEARAAGGDVVNVILYDKATPATRNKNHAPQHVSAITPVHARLDGPSVGH